MKQFFTLLLTLMVCTLAAHAQCSNNFYKLERGAEYEMTIYNKKDKVEGKVMNTIISVENSGGGQQATFHSKILDKKDKLVSEGEYDIICEGDKIKINMEKMFASMQQLSNYENASIQVKGDYIEIPSHLEVGTILPESKSNMTIQMGESSMTMSSTDMYLKNRKVEKKEDITTPAGTFACYKITYDMDMDMKIMGINRKMSSAGAEWIAEGVGIVKTATYDNKGEIESYTLLTHYK